MAYHPQPQPREENLDSQPEERMLLLTSRLLVTTRRQSQLLAEQLSEPQEWELCAEMAPQVQTPCSSMGYFLYHPDQQISPYVADIPMLPQH